MVPHLFAVLKRRLASATLAQGAAGLLVLSGLFVASSSSAAEDQNYPGLPHVADTGGWVGPRASGISHIDRAKQWIRLPPISVGAFNRIIVVKTDTRCRPLGGRLVPYRQTNDFHATGFFRSSKGAAEPWGYVGPFVTRTVAFGNIPVEASVQMRQPRDEENLPVGFEIKQKLGFFCDGESPYPGYVGDNTLSEAATVEGQVEIAVTKLVVDGVDLALAKNCRTNDLGSIKLTGRPWYSGNPENEIPGVRPIEENLFTTPYFLVTNGGLLEGNVDIPAFTGCLTQSGEDVSRLLTAAVSGSGNGVTMRSEGVKTEACMQPDAPTGPGQLCGPLPGLDLP